MVKFAVIGNPVQHSLSPEIHQAFAQQVGLEMIYEKIESPLDGFSQAIALFKEQGGRGCNVTLPFKAEAYAIANKIGDNVKLACASNCLLFEEDGTIYADNFDGVGLIEDLVGHQGFDLCDKKILIIGAGGAVQGIVGALLDKSPQEVVIANRTAERAESIAKTFQLKGPICGIGLDELTGSPYDLVIHASSLGHKQRVVPLPSGIVIPSTLCYDISFGEAALPFLDWARSQGARVCLDGLGMLVEQAAASFHLWNGVYPDTKPILERFLK